MKRLMKNVVVSMALAAALLPVAALAITQPTVPPGVGGEEITGSRVIQIIEDVVQIVIILSVTIAIGFFIYGGIRYAMGNADEGKTILKNAAIGLLAILAVGLVVSTIAGFVQRGGQLG
jgi:hypothetical protein